MRTRGTGRVPPQRLQHEPEPAARCGRVRQAPPRRDAAADGDAVAAESLRGRDAVEVGHVVADVDRPAAGERRLAEEGLDGGALRDPGRLQFVDERTSEQLPRRAEARECPLGGLADDGLERRRPPVVQRDARPLVLEQQARVGVAQSRERRARRRRYRGRRLLDPAERGPSLQPVQARGRQPQRVEHRVERRQRSSGDERDRAVQRDGEAGQQVEEFPVGPDRVRVRLELEQRPVHVEEQRPLSGRRRRGPGRHPGDRTAQRPGRGPRGLHASADSQRGPRFAAIGPPVTPDGKRVTTGLQMLPACG